VGVTRRDAATGDGVVEDLLDRAAGRFELHGL
jgi:hypothetical protein